MRSRKKALYRRQRPVASRSKRGKRRQFDEPINSAPTSQPNSGNLNRSLGYAIRRAQIHAYPMFTNFMSDFNIRPAQYALLVFIHENPGVTQSVVGNALGIEKANLAGLLTEMHPRKVIKRRSLTTDRRAYSLHLTVAGRKLIRKLLKRHEQYENALASSLGPGSREQLLLLLGKLVHKS